jgi:integrase
LRRTQRLASEPRADHAQYFDHWLVTGQIVPTNPAASVRGPKHVVKVGKTALLDPAEARTLLDSIDVTTQAGLRDRALIGLMVYSFARVGAALAMKVEDVYVQNRRLWVRLHEKGGKRFCREPQSLGTRTSPKGVIVVSLNAKMYYRMAKFLASAMPPSGPPRTPGFSKPTVALM